MKYIILGLGSFGASLAEKLTLMGHEVIGVDNKMSKVSAIKDKITHAVNLDYTERAAVSSLPLKETDVVIVAIGEDTGANILATALMRQLKVKRLISRAVSPLQETILEAMGVDEIIHPEEETAERWSKKLNSEGIVDSFELSEEFSIIETRIPKEYHDKTLEEVGLRRNYNLIALTTIKKLREKNALGAERVVKKVQGLVTAQTVLHKDDLIVVYGYNKDIKKFLKDQE